MDKYEILSNCLGARVSEIARALFKKRSVRTFVEYPRRWGTKLSALRNSLLPQVIRTGGEDRIVGVTDC